MKIALFGATGGTGRQVLAQALAAGHQVTVLVRDPAKLAGHQVSDLTVIQGNVLKAEDVDRAVAGSDAVCCTLGQTPGNPDTVTSQGTANIIEAMKQHVVRRLVAVTSLGVGDSKDQVPFAFKVAMKTVPGLKKAMADKEEQEKAIRESGLDWIIVRPGGLTDGPKTGQYTFGTDPKIVARQISRADLADFVLRQLIDDAFLHQAVAVT